MVALARKTLIHEWRRFFPAVLAVAFSGLLLLVQTALVLGIFGSAAVFVDKSRGDLWIGYPGTRSVELGRAIPLDSEIWLRLDPAVARVESFLWVDGDWRSRSGQGAVSVSVSGIEPGADGLMFARALPAEMRERLRQPDSVIVDHADLDKLGVSVGGRARINGRQVQVVGAAQQLRALGGVNILASLDTARRLRYLGDGVADDMRMTYYVVKLHDPGAAPAVAARLNREVARHGFEAWTSSEFSQRAVSFWMFETGAGLGVLFMSLVVCVVGVVITSQTLMAAVAGSIDEYATLHALGVGLRELRRVVLEQAAWVGAGGLLIGVLGSAGALVLAFQHDVPVALGVIPGLICAGLVMTISLLSGMAAVRVLRHADAANLLR
ncbi:MAG: ABC transporter permease [Betaproteobacteria bacterium]|nr:ABC transporter permease [Betaproteobacteria bacterium]